FFLAFFNVTKRSLSACVISSSPSCIPKAWGLSRGHFYFAQRGHYHFAASVQNAIFPRGECVRRSELGGNYSRIWFPPISRGRSNRLVVSPRSEEHTSEL